MKMVFVASDKEKSVVGGRKKKMIHAEPTLKRLQICLHKSFTEENYKVLYICCLSAEPMLRYSSVAKRSNNSQPKFSS